MGVRPNGVLSQPYREQDKFANGADVPDWVGVGRERGARAGDEGAERKELDAPRGMPGEREEVGPRRAVGDVGKGGTRRLFFGRALGRYFIWLGAGNLRV